jgi:hypothetical protein
VNKLLFAAAAAAVFACAGLASSNQAMAQDWNDHYNDRYDRRHQTYTGTNVPLGEAGAHWGNQCWVETWGSGSSYFGYWQPCAPAKEAKR